MTVLQEGTPRAGKRTRKFTPANIQKIQNWVAEGISREEIAKSLGVTVGSLQVTCSRMGISLRKPKMFKQSRRVESRPHIPNHPPMFGQVGLQDRRVHIQFVIRRDGKRCKIDVPLTASDIARLGLEAAVQNRTITQLLTQAVRITIKKDLIEEILPKSAPTGAPPNANGRA